MRQLKFRAWDGKAMEYWRLDDMYDTTFYGIPPENVMQFTGLHDRTGKKIYEGDVVLCPNGKKYEIGFTCGMFNAVGYWKDTSYDFIESATTSEVIGNIYENPELLSTDNTKEV